MNWIPDILSRGGEQLLGRASGPFHLRLFLTPIVATVFAIRAGLKDAREGQPAFLLEFFTNPAERRRLADSGWRDIGKMIVAAFVVDTIYQVAILQAFYIVQALILIAVIAVIPYCLIRGIANRVMRAVTRKAEQPVVPPESKVTTAGR